MPSTSSLARRQFNALSRVEETKTKIAEFLGIEVMDALRHKRKEIAHVFHLEHVAEFLELVHAKLVSGAETAVDVAKAVADEATEAVQENGGVVAAVENTLESVATEIGTPIEVAIDAKIEEVESRVETRRRNRRK
jgi:high-affinity K+ transport system ATPase subunit B